jgi:hypothetical protein
MRCTGLCVLLLTPLAHAQVVNGGIEEATPAAGPPNQAWTLKGALLPSGWLFNGQDGGPIEVVTDAHTGRYALSVGKGETLAHLPQPLVPVKTGDCITVSAWVKSGQLLTSRDPCYRRRRIVQSRCAPSPEAEDEQAPTQPQTGP